MDVLSMTILEFFIAKCLLPKDDVHHLCLKLQSCILQLFKLLSIMGLAPMVMLVRAHLHVLR